MSGSVPSGDGDGMDECIDPRLTLLTLDGAVSTPDLVDLNDWIRIEDGGSARSPSLVNFSSYAGSSADSPSNDVGFASLEMEQPEFPVAHAPTALSATTGDTMHDIAAAQHGVFTETPGPWNMTMPANELAALHANYSNVYNQAQLGMDQGYDFNTIHSIPNPPAFMMQSNANPSSET
ncbi:hypothetical protein B0H65DRAFT_244962 [Neurospora tetraspora]|uniref:Uncharacterized protein n=1 Tax=Neurospora tetraspora TaxID=94610 RepID=A0AAE0JF02_9PEZI|nr:hypothetical protein B0H65DRAFT_244962 [Neurospora tetraspora]